MKSKAKINLLIDIIMLINMMAIAGLGFLIKFTLVPGYKRNEIYGRDVDLYYMGLDRHEWGSIHLILSFIFIGLLLLHIVFHWNAIICLFRRYVGIKSIRYITVSIIVIFSLVFALFSFIIKPEIVELENSSIRNQDNLRDIDFNIKIIDSLPIQESLKFITKPQAKIGYHNNHKHHDIRGNMTLHNVSKKHNIPVKYLKKQLNISENESADIRLSWLKKRYGFTMSEVSTAIDRYNKNQ